MLFVPVYNCPAWINGLFDFSPKKIINADINLILGLFMNCQRFFFHLSFQMEKSVSKQLCFDIKLLFSLKKEEDCFQSKELKLARWFLHNWTLNLSQLKLYFFSE